MLTDVCATKDAGCQEHLVCWLEYPDEMGRIPLRQRNPFSEAFKADAPGKASFGPADLDHPVQTARDRG